MTTDARLSALERSQIDTNHEITILTGVIGEQGRDIKRMLAVLEQHTHTLDVHTASLQTIEQALATLITEVRDIKQIVTQNGQE